MLWNFPFFVTNSNNKNDSTFNERENHMHEHLYKEPSVPVLKYVEGGATI